MPHYLIAAAGSQLTVSLPGCRLWSAAFDYSLSRAQLHESLARSNAFQEDLRSYKLLFPPAKPAA
jgi:hypothetical protein